MAYNGNRRLSAARHTHTQLITHTPTLTVSLSFLSTNTLYDSHPIGPFTVTVPDSLT